MKGAIVVVTPPTNLLAELAVVASESGFTVRVGGESVQVSDAEGRLLTMFEDADPGWEWRHATPIGTDRQVELSGFGGFATECRWEALFCELIGALGARVRDVQVVDGDGVLWPADQLDASRIRL